MKLALVGLTLLAALYGVHRLALWAEQRVQERREASDSGDPPDAGA